MTITIDDRSFLRMAAKSVYLAKGYAPPAGLTFAETNNLRSHLCDHPPGIGFHSSFYEALVVASGKMPSGGSLRRQFAFDTQMEEGWCECVDRGDIRRDRIIRRAIELMQERGKGRLACVLQLLYGPRSPSAPYEDFGDLAPIVHLTDVAEAARVQLALRAGEENYARIVREYPGALEREHETIAFEFWSAVRMLQRIERAAEKPGADMVDHATSRARQWQFLEQLLKAYAYDGTVPARISAVAKPDREITVEAAVRWRLQIPRDSENRPVLDVSGALGAARVAFIASARRSAEKLRLEACEAYQNALKAAAEELS